MGSEVLMPWPISGFFETMVTMPSGAMDIKADSVAGAAAAVVRACSGIVASSRNPPPASRAVFSKVRLLSSMFIASGNMVRLLMRAGGDLDRGLNPVVTGAAADISRHRRVDLLERGAWSVREQGSRGHDLPGLAVATLHDIDLQPGLLQSGTHGCFTNVLDGGDSGIAQTSHRRLARALGGAVHMDRAGSAKSRATSVLGSHETELIAQHPQQRHFGRRLKLVYLSIDMQLVFHCAPPP